MRTWKTRAALGACLMLGACARPAPAPQAAAAPTTTAASHRAASDGVLPEGMREALEDAARLFPQWTLSANDQAVLDAHGAQRIEALRRHLATLLASPGARGQLDYALLSWLAGSAGDDAAAMTVAIARRNQAIANAAKADPDDAMAAWMEAVVCSDARLCDKAAARGRLQRLEPDNALAWLLELDDPTLGERQIGAVLARMAASPQMADIHDRTTLRTHEAMQRAAMPAPDARVLRILDADPTMRGRPTPEARQFGEALGVATVALPSLQPLSRACRGELTALRHASCLAVMTRFANAGNHLFEIVGTRSMLVLTADQPAHAYWRERDRLQRWRMANPPMPMDARWLDLRMRMNEVDAFDTVQALQGRPATPPLGWKPREWGVARASAPDPVPPGS